MKTKLQLFRILTAVLLILLVCSSGYSQKVISSVNVDKSVETVSKYVTTNSDEMNIEHNNSENWMQNKNYLELYSSYENYKMLLVAFEKVNEKEQSIENWMLDKNYWKINNTQTSEMLDEPREIESWMLDKSFWTIKDEPDRKRIEKWMLDNEFWVIVK